MTNKINLKIVSNIKNIKKEERQMFEKYLFLEGVSKDAIDAKRVIKEVVEKLENQSKKLNEILKVEKRTKIRIRIKDRMEYNKGLKEYCEGILLMPNDELESHINNRVILS